MTLAAIVFAALALAGAAPAAAAAAVLHRVMPGETLWSIAAANNLTTRSVAAYNDLAQDADVVLGTTIDVPTEAEAAAALGSAGTAPASGDEGGSGGGAYVVEAGDTLSEIAARAGASADDLAARNGVNADGVLVAGTVLELPGGDDGAASSGDTTDDDGTEGSTSSSSSGSSGPAATGEQVSSGDIAAIAEAHGVPGSLAAAIAWQESGFDNGVVSSADARGVMQIMPGTWDFIQDTLAAGPLGATSAQENVHAGVMYLRYLLDQTGGDPSFAAASYYQGLGSVRGGGMLPETRRYVDNVLALRSRFGGP